MSVKINRNGKEFVVTKTETGFEIVGNRMDVMCNKGELNLFITLMAEAD